MTTQRELDSLLGAFLAEGPAQVADRVIDGALDQIEHVRQRRVLRLPWRFPQMTLTRLAAAAVIGVLLVGSTFYVIQHGLPAIGGPRPTPSTCASPSQPAATPTPLNPTPLNPTPLNPTPLNPTPTTQAALTGPLGDGRQIHTATPLDDGCVLFVGGYALGDGALASAALYDPKTNAFSPTGSLATARGLHTATRLLDGRVLIAGGGPTAWNNNGVFLTSAELYDPTTGTFSPTGSMATPREGHTATLLTDGRVLIAGGSDQNGHAVISAELYDPTTGTFSPTGSMAAARGFHTATLLADGRVLIAGGAPAAWNSASGLTSVEIYNPTTGTFSPTGSMAEARAFHAAALLADGRVLLTGGGGPTTDLLASAEIYDPDTGTFTSTGSMAHGRTYHTATLLADGRVLIAGGGGDYTNRNFLASAEIYDPDTGTFTSTGSMADKRTYHTATLLPDGRVLVTGGYGARAPLASAELYDPTTGTFSPAGLQPQ